MKCGPPGIENTPQRSANGSNVATRSATVSGGNFVVTYESILPNLTALRQYKPMLREFWREGLFEPMDRRYFRLISRATRLEDVVNWDVLDDYSPYETFRAIFQADNLQGESYFDRMTHFDFKTLLPSLLHVEDRMSMAHGVESRVPLVDHPLVELAATIPADIKFKDGQLKHVMKTAFGHLVPGTVLARTDKMGFPTPLIEFSRGEARAFVSDAFSGANTRHREYFNNDRILVQMAIGAMPHRDLLRAIELRPGTSITFGTVLVGSIFRAIAQRYGLQD